LDQVECPSLGNIPAGQNYQLDFSYRFPANATCNGTYTDSAVTAADNVTGVTSEATTTVQCASSSSSSSVSSAAPQCNDGMDNDNDGAIDQNDFSCSGPTDNDETNPKAACQDGVDNDSDNLIDSNDPGCHTD